MDEKQKPVCGLCQRHQKLETVESESRALLFST